MRGDGSSPCTMLLLLFCLLPLVAVGAPAASGVCGHGCDCSHSPGVANCSSFVSGSHAQLPAELWSLHVQPSSPGLASFLKHRLHDYRRHLTELHLADNEVVGAHLPELNGFRRLRVLDLSFCEVSNPSQVSALVKHSNSLVSLSLRGNPLLTLQPLSSDTLKDLDMSDCSIVSVPANAFIRLPRLQSLSLARNRLFNLAAELPPGLISLDLSGNALTHVSPKLVASVGRIDVSGNPLHCTCSVLLQRNVRSNTYVLDGSGAMCVAPEQFRGVSLISARRFCTDRVGTGSRHRRQADPLDLTDGSGNGEGDGIGEDDEWDNDTDLSAENDDDGGDDNDYYDEDDSLIPSGSESESPKAAPSSPPSIGSSSNTSEAPQALPESTRSLEDDIYEPTVPPPVPASVDAAEPSVPASEIPPESGPPVAETEEGSYDKSRDETEKFDNPSEHKEETVPVEEAAPDVSENGNTGVDVMNEIMGNEDEYDDGTADDNDEDYDYDLTGESDNFLEPEASSNNTGTLPDVIPDTTKEGEDSLLTSNASVILSSEAETKDLTSDSPVLFNAEDTDKNFEDSVIDNDESINEAVVPNSKASTLDNGTVLHETENNVSESSLELVDDSLSLIHNVTRKDEEVSISANPMESEGSGEEDDDKSIPVGPITGFIGSDGQDSIATTTDISDDGTLIIDDELGEDNDGNSPLLPPGVEETSGKSLTSETETESPDLMFVASTNNTGKQAISGIDEQEDTEEGSGLSLISGEEDWEIGEANETDVTTSIPIPVQEEELLVHKVIPVGSAREISSTSEPLITTSTSEKPQLSVHGGLFRFNIMEEDSDSSTIAPVHTEPPLLGGIGGPSSSLVAPDDVVAASDVIIESGYPKEVEEEPIATAAPVPAVHAAPDVVTSQSPLPEEPPVIPTEVPVPPPGVDGDGESAPGVVPESDDESEDSEVETVAPTGDAPTNDTARVVVAAGEKPAEETPLNSAGSYVVLGIIMALVVFLLGYAVVRSRRGRQRAAAKAGGKDAEAAGGQQEGRELKEISKPLLGQVPASTANGKGEHLQPLVTKPSDNPDLKDDDADDIPNEKPLLEPTPKIHVYETLNGGEKERVPVHPPSPKKSPSGEGEAVVPPVPEKRRALSRLPESAVDSAPNMYGSDGLPGEVVRASPAVNGAATSPGNGLSTFAPPVSPSSGRVKVVAREDPDSIPKKPVFVVNQGPGAASGVV